MHKAKQQGLAAALSANIIFGLNIPVTRSLVTEWMTPMGYTITRMFFGAAIFWLIGAVLREDQVRRKDLWVMLGGGLMGFLGTQLFFSQALQYTTPVVFSLLMALAPVVVLLLSSVFLKEKIPMRKVLGILISIVGAVLIIWQSSSSPSGGKNDALGILFALLCVLCFAGYLVLTRKISVRYQPVSIAKWMFLFSALAAMPFSYSGLQHQLVYSSQATTEAYGLLAFALLMSTTLAFFLMPIGLKYLEASTVSIYMNLQPVVASGVAILIGQDIFTWDKPLAAALVIIGVMVVTTQRSRSAEQMPQPQ